MRMNRDIRDKFLGLAPPLRAYKPTFFGNTVQAFGLQLSPWGRADSRNLTVVKFLES